MRASRSDPRARNKASPIPTSLGKMDRVCCPSAARFRHRACDRDLGREACLHGDGRHVLAVRPIRRAFGRDLLYGLRCQDERQGQRSGAAGDVRVQWRARGGLGFLNLGLVGPRIAVFGNGFDGAHVRLTDNPDTWLAFTDLVMIDPVGTAGAGPPSLTALARSGACIAIPSRSPR